MIVHKRVMPRNLPVPKLALVDMEETALWECEDILSTSAGPSWDPKKNKWVITETGSIFICCGPRFNPTLAIPKSITRPMCG